MKPLDREIRKYKNPIPHHLSNQFIADVSLNYSGGSLFAASPLPLLPAPLHHIMNDGDHHDQLDYDQHDHHSAFIKIKIANKEEQMKLKICTGRQKKSNWGKCFKLFYSRDCDDLYGLLKMFPHVITKTFSIFKTLSLHPLKHKHKKILRYAEKRMILDCRN